MNTLTINQDSRVKEKFQTYPEAIKARLNHLRRLILETAAETEGITEIEETLKWGEPSYLVKNGRIALFDRYKVTRIITWKSIA